MGSGRTLKPLAAALAAWALLAGAPVAAQTPDPEARELAHKLARAEHGLHEDRYARAAGPFAGALSAREARRITLTLRAGLDYSIVAVCAGSCGAVDVRVADPNQRGIVSQSGAAVVRPAFTGAHELEIEMPACEQARCWYAVNVYSR